MVFPLSSRVTTKSKWEGWVWYVYSNFCLATQNFSKVEVSVTIWSKGVIWPVDFFSFPFPAKIARKAYFYRKMYYNCYFFWPKSSAPTVIFRGTQIPLNWRQNEISTERCTADVIIGGQKVFVIFGFWKKVPGGKVRCNNTVQSVISFEILDFTTGEGARWKDLVKAVILVYGFVYIPPRAKDIRRTAWNYPSSRLATRSTLWNWVANLHLPLLNH